MTVSYRIMRECICKVELAEGADTAGDCEKPAVNDHSPTDNRLRLTPRSKPPPAPFLLGVLST